MCKEYNKHIIDNLFVFYFYQCTPHRWINFFLAEIIIIVNPAWCLINMIYVLCCHTKQIVVITVWNDARFLFFFWQVTSLGKKLILMMFQPHAPVFSSTIKQSHGTLSRSSAKAYGCAPLLQPDPMSCNNIMVIGE